MAKETKLGGPFRFPAASASVYRMGYGAMQLAGPGVWGPPRNVDAAVAVLREAIASGVNHIDTSDFYGPHVTWSRRRARNNDQVGRVGMKSLLDNLI